MRKYIFGVFMLITMLCGENTIAGKSKTFSNVVPLGGNAYIISGRGNESINEKGITNWKNKDTEYAVYFSSPRASKVKIYLTFNQQNNSSSIQLKLNQKSNLLSVAAGKSDKLCAGDFELIEGYNTLIIKGISKNGENFAGPENLVIETTESLDLNFVKENSGNRFYWGRRGPSVHLGYVMPENKNIKWFYNEITVPMGKDPIGSYFMANGFGEGYFGIQVNSETERRILFSVWSPFHTDNPNEIPDAEKIKLLKKGENVKTGEFGNEGSGGQSFKIYPWKAGITYAFLNSVEPDGKGNTVYTAYFKDPDVGQWMLIASFSRPKTTTWYKHAHSFLENFNPSQGFIERKVLFGNQWVCDTNGEWTELNKARFTGDDIAKTTYRLDREGGVTDQSFYLRNGGFFNTKVILFSPFERKMNNQKPIIDFSSLP